MLIDFSKLEEKRNEHFKGGEGAACIKTCTDGVNKVLQVRLEPGSSIGLHTHEGDCEMFLILSGEGRVVYDGEAFDIRPGQAHYCPQGHQHTLINTGSEDLLVFAVIPRQNPDRA